jgi:predicted ATPase/class 3 adenylate cyclase
MSNRCTDPAGAPLRFNSYALRIETLTFLFTDIEGSTRLLQELDERYADVLMEHYRVLRKAFRAHGGVEQGTQGDSFFYVFPSASAAVSGAADAQQALGGGPPRVRIGIHTGEAVLTAEGYTGLDVHKAARIAAAGHGGQVVLSRETRGQLDSTVPLLDLGEHRVKDFDGPVWLFQFGTDTFPPLRTISNTNLPRLVSSFVGRGQEVRDVGSLVRNGSRLVTLTGSGGSGKTRLAIEVAAGLVSEFRAGVFWVGLAPLREPALVTETIGRTLGAKAGPVAHIGEREMLLLLDNLEQVIEAAPALSALLKACPNLFLLVTSRELLRIQGEVEYPVLPLADPEAVELFCARARIESDATVADLCRALDNLPLAVELAAARASVFSPAQAYARLSGRLDIFKGGRDADPRQQTLRATIEWSYDLLGSVERCLFACLGVFSGGFTLEAAEQVADAELDVLQALVDKSLLRHTGERFWMLETIREYAVERLDELDAATDLRRRHAAHFVALAERADSELARERQADWLVLLERDYANLRSALAWSLRSEAAELGVRLAGALSQFWSKRGYLSEGRLWLADALAVSDRGQARAKVLFSAALLATLQGDWPEAKRLSEYCHQLSLQIGEPRLAARSLLTLGRVTVAEGDHVRACSLFEEAAELATEIDDTTTLAMAHFNLGYAALSGGDFVRARNEIQAAREQFDEDADLYGTSRSLAGLGSVALQEGRPGEAVAHLRQSLVISRTLGDQDDIVWALQLLGVATAESQSEKAARLLGAAEALRETLGVSLSGTELALHERAVASLRSALHAETLTTAWAIGRDLALVQAIEQALADD